MLDVGDHDGRRVQIKLLYRVIGSQGEEACARTIDSEASDMFESRDGIIGDVLCSNIP